MVDAGLKKVSLRALLTCRSKYGVCQKCYGWDLSTRCLLYTSRCV